MKKQITVDGSQSDWFDKAIFILKEAENPYIPGNLFQYAEQLVENQLKRASGRSSYQNVEKKAGDEFIQTLQAEAVKKRKTASKKQRKDKWIDSFLYVSISFCFICVVLLLFKMYG